jgi:lipopolysaccharide transport protein LptA
MRGAKCIALGLLMLFSSGGMLLAQAPKDSPLRIESKRFSVLHKSNQAVFEKKVVITRDDVTIRCDRLEVNYVKGSGGGERSGGFGRSDIKSMLLTGDVMIEQGERRGHCEKADYNGKTGRLVCTGDPWVAQGANRVRGEKIIYHTHKDEIQVIKPRAVLYVKPMKTSRSKKSGNN